MKALKKLAGMILAVCLMIPMLGTVAFAADGVLMFSDPSGKVGENVNVDLVVQSSSGTVGDVNVTMSYDAAALEFVSGEGFTADGGTLTYTGTGSSSELRATVTFRALQATDTTLSVSSSTAVLSTGETLNLEQGSSAISIAAADDGTTSVEPTTTTTQTAGDTTDIAVTVNGREYNFSEAFTTSDIPEGYSETTMTFHGGERKFVVNEAGVYLGFLVDGAGSGSFFLFDTEDATFAPFVLLTISDTTSIIPLDKPDEVNLPDNYQESELTVQDQVFPIWSNPSVSDRYYVIYALNTRTGQEDLYQYDSEDETYQYFSAPEPVAEEEETKTALPGAAGAFISEHILPILVAGGAVCLLLLILMIIFAVKLVHRNQELDDLYDEYDIPFDDEEEEDKKKPGKKASASAEEPVDEFDDDIEYDDEIEYDDDDFDAEYDDEFDEEEYDDESDSEEYEDDEYGYDDEDLDGGYDDEDVFDDEDDFDAGYEPSGKGRGGRNSKKKEVSDDDYDINFIDL